MKITAMTKETIKMEELKELFKNKIKIKLLSFSNNFIYECYMINNDNYDQSMFILDFTNLKIIYDENQNDKKEHLKNISIINNFFINNKIEEKKEFKEVNKKRKI